MTKYFGYIIVRGELFKVSRNHAFEHFQRFWSVGKSCQILISIIAFLSIGDSGDVMFVLIEAIDETGEADLSATAWLPICLQLRRQYQGVVELVLIYWHSLPLMRHLLVAENANNLPLFIVTIPAA